MSERPPRKLWERPYEYEGKIVHDGPATIFHRRDPQYLGQTYCGLALGGDARSTDHKLLDHSPCAVCFAPKDAA